MNAKKICQEMLKSYFSGKKKFPVAHGVPREGWDAVAFSGHMLLFIRAQDNPLDLSKWPESGNACKRLADDAYKASTWIRRTGRQILTRDGVCFVQFAADDEDSVRWIDAALLKFLDKDSVFKTGEYRMVYAYDLGGEVLAAVIAPAREDLEKVVEGECHR